MRQILQSNMTRFLTADRRNVSSRRTNFLHHLGQSSNMGKIWESDLGKMNFKHLIYLFLSVVEK